jgi:diguanylate cyclase (GGDEF)-like protein
MATRWWRPAWSSSSSTTDSYRRTWRSTGDRYDQALRRAERQGGGGLLVLVDLNGFKQINDSAGHLAGDRVLQRVADRLVGAVRRSDTVARLGGDEFVLVLGGAWSADAERELRAKITATVTRPIQVDGRQHRVGVAAGFARFPQGGTDLESLLARADRAMYEDKRHAGGGATATIASTGRSRGA